MITELLNRYPSLFECKDDIEKAAKAIIECYENGGKLKETADICICAPQTETYKIQELHLPIYHYLCAAVEERFFND